MLQDNQPTVSTGVSDVDAMFAGDALTAVPSRADSYSYKKTGGSSDTKTTYDSFD